MAIKYFPNPAGFRRWLAKNHGSVDELWVGFHKKGTGKPSLTWSESVDEALCYGWIDGIRKSVDDGRCKIRFTPRKAGSAWSALNLRKMKQLEKEGRMTAAGHRAFEARDESKSGYAVKDLAATLDAVLEKTFRGQRSAWSFFGKQPAGYRRLAVYWVMNAKRQETRERRLAKLIEVSARGERLPELTSKPAKKKPTPRR